MKYTMLITGRLTPKMTLDLMQSQLKPQAIFFFHGAWQFEDAKDQEQQVLEKVELDGRASLTLK